jgi:hypothetical protein
VRRHSYPDQLYFSAIRSFPNFLLTLSRLYCSAMTLFCNVQILLSEASDWRGSETLKVRTKEPTKEHCDFRRLSFSNIVPAELGTTRAPLNAGSPNGIPMRAEAAQHSRPLGGEVSLSNLRGHHN